MINKTLVVDAIVFRSYCKTVAEQCSPTQPETRYPIQTQSHTLLQPDSTYKHPPTHAPLEPHYKHIAVQSDTHSPMHHTKEREVHCIKQCVP